MATQPWDWDWSFEHEDVGTLEPLAEMPESEVLKFLLPESEWREGKRYRCCRKDTFAQFCRQQLLSNERFVHLEAEGEYKSFVATPLLGVDLLALDADFVQRLIEEGPSGCGGEGRGDSHSQAPLLLQVSAVQRLQPHQVKDPVWGNLRDPRHQVVVNLHYVAEASVERAMWCALDRAMSSLTCGRCPLGHRMKQTHAPVPWVCDRCERSFTRAAKPRRCSMNCDFDFCEKCAEAEPSQCEAAQVLSELRRSLAEVSSSGSSLLKIPQRPPQENSIHVLRVNARVTKWNACQLDAEVAKEVRRSFMEAIKVDSDSEHWRAFLPGTGQPAIPAKYGKVGLCQHLGIPLARCACTIIIVALVLPTAWRMVLPPLQAAFGPVA